ncbi:MAG: rod shape-determining protein MreD [Bacteroidales bacterium]|jgi:cell shape-determining protein MreD|nr:rod shape-determining protein MreD [Bacteroidales bacterium]
MNSIVVKNIARFVILVLIQVFVLNNIRINGYINPYLYVLFILLLPFEIPGWLLLASSFLLGFSIDIFVHTPGLHTTASVFMAFFRPGMIKMISRNTTIEQGMSPGVRDMGFRWFFAYSLVLIFLHHLLLFFLEVFRFNEFFDTMIRIGLSTVATLILVFVVEYLFINNKDKD